jgi:hypothetical protein
MNRKELIATLRRSAAGGDKRSPFCPEDGDIAAFVDDTLSASEHSLIERHLPDCPACVGRVGLVTRLLRDDTTTVADETPSRHKTWRKVAPQWAVAATIILAITWVSWSPQPAETVIYRDARSVEPVQSVPKILVPESGVLADRDGFLIRWTDVPGSLYYKVRVVSASGDLLSEERVEVTEWSLGNEIILEPGQEYFIRVDAYLSDSKAISSQHMPFRLRD